MRKSLFEKLLVIMENLWETQSHVYRELLSESEFIEIKKSLSNSTFPFSPMYRSWIPKPNKPGQLRPITQPHKADILVMDSLSYLLNSFFADLFLKQSHGFRPGRGPITFFLQVHSWGFLLPQSLFWFTFVLGILFGIKPTLTCRGFDNPVFFLLMGKIGCLSQ